MSLAPVHDIENGSGVFKLEKFRDGEDIPYETIETNNTWLTTGWTELMALIKGSSSNHFGSTTKIGIGNDTTAAAVGQTDLIATGANTCYITIDSGYPTASGTTLIYKSTFTKSDANFAWEEAVLKQPTSGICWNRCCGGAGTWGTKTNADVWVMTLTIGK